MSEIAMRPGLRGVGTYRDDSEHCGVLRGRSLLEPEFWLFMPDDEPGVVRLINREAFVADREATDER